MEKLYVEILVASKSNPKWPYFELSTRALYSDLKRRLLHRQSKSSYTQFN